jgi:hypothetical protein
MNVAIVDTDTSPALLTRFNLPKNHIVMLFRHGWVHLYKGKMELKNMDDSIAAIKKFAKDDWQTAPSMPVPAEPHVATDHEKGFNYFVGGMCVLMLICFIIDLCLQFHYKRQKAAASKAEKKE